MGKSVNVLFHELSNEEFIDMCMNTLEEDEKENKDAILATLIVHVNTHAHQRADADGVYGDISYSDIAKVANSLLVGKLHGYTVAPSGKE